MSNYQFSADLVNDILFRAGEPTDGSSDFNAAALQYLNRAYQALWMGGTEIDPGINENWWWLWQESNLIMQAALTSGTVSVSSSVSTATISATITQAGGVSGWFFRVGGVSEETYLVVSGPTTGAVIKLDSQYIGATQAAANYTLWLNEYSLASDVLRLATPMRLTKSNARGSAYARAGREYQILGLTNRELEETSPLSLISTGVPAFFAQVGDQKVRFDRYAATRVRADYTYLQRPASLTSGSAEEPVVPLQYRKLLSDIALVFLFTDKNDNRAQAIATIAQSGVKAMALENRSRIQIYGMKVAGLAPSPILEVAVGAEQRKAALDKDYV